MDEEHDLPPDVAAKVERQHTLRRRLRYDRASNTRPTARIEDEAVRARVSTNLVRGVTRARRMIRDDEVCARLAPYARKEC